MSRSPPAWERERSPTRSTSTTSFHLHQRFVRSSTNFFSRPGSASPTKHYVTGHCQLVWHRVREHIRHSRQSLGRAHHHKRFLFCLLSSSPESDHRHPPSTTIQTSCWWCQRGSTLPSSSLKLLGLPSYKQVKLRRGTTDTSNNTLTSL